jgi:cold shock CspA family protein
MAQSYTRLQGRIESWNDQRGFGFVVQNSTGKKAFVHISALAERHRRPVVGALVIYEETHDERGRPRAVNVHYVTHKVLRAPRAASDLWSRVVTALVLIVVGAVAYSRLSHPESSGQDSVSALASAEESHPDHTKFQCEPNKHRCPQMTSCEEARFYLAHCPDPEMDGDHDGEPCEDQWCR